MRDARFSIQQEATLTFSVLGRPMLLMMMRRDSVEFAERLQSVNVPA